MNVTMVGQLLVNLCYSKQIYKCEVTITYNKYTLISNYINFLCTSLYPIWYLCGYICGSSFSNMILWKHSRMGDKVKQVTLCNQAIKCKLVWSYKYWSIKEGLSSISSLPLCILHQIISNFNMCWWWCDLITQTRDNNIINIITQ